MLSTLLVVSPVFALIFSGWLLKRIGVFSPHATAQLNRFVVYLAIPALLFDIVANAHWADFWRPDFIAAFGLSAALIFVAILAVRLRQSQRLADAAIDALNASYANTGFIGFPLMLVVFGDAALVPTAIATLIVVCVMFAVGVVLIEIGLKSEAHPARLAGKVANSLLRNPLIFSPILGALFPLAGLSVPAPLETFLKLLGGAAAPCALVTLGLFLAEKREDAERNVSLIATLIGCKLLLQPLLAWGLATFVFQLSKSLSHIAVLLAALPTGTGPFMVAELYRREAGVTSSVILISTILSIFTVSGYIWFVR